MKTVLALAGSIRHGSYNRRLVRAAAALAPAGMTFRIFDDLARIPMFNEDDRTAESVRHLADAVAAADALFIATPEYNWSIPGVLKNAIDWLSVAMERLLTEKPVAIAGATSGRWGTRLAQADLRQILTSTGSLVLPSPALFIADAASAFDEEGRVTDPRVRRELEALLAAFAAWIELHEVARV